VGAVGGSKFHLSHWLGTSLIQQRVAIAQAVMYLVIYTELWFELILHLVRDVLRVTGRYSDISFTWWEWRTHYNRRPICYNEGYWRQGQHWVFWLPLNLLLLAVWCCKIITQILLKCLSFGHTVIFLSLAARLEFHIFVKRFGIIANLAASTLYTYGTHVCVYVPFTKLCTLFTATASIPN